MCKVKVGDEVKCYLHGVYGLNGKVIKVKEYDDGITVYDVDGKAGYFHGAEVKKVKPLFNLNDCTGCCVMHCKTRKQANKFCKFLAEQGKTWNSGDSYLDKDYFNEFKNKLCYAFNDGQCMDIEFYEKNGYTILEAKDFRFK